MRYAILSDVHGNLAALQAVVADLSTQAIDATFYLGDAVGYYADSMAVIALLGEIVKPQQCHYDGRPAIALPWVAGNHEWGLLGRLEAHLFSTAALTAIERTRADLSGAMRTFLEGLPQRIELDLTDGLKATLIHASPTDPIGAAGSSYVENGEDARETAHAFSTPLCLIGHTHCPRVCAEARAPHGDWAFWDTREMFEEVLPGGCYHFGPQRLILNPGSVGQPRDGDPRAAYAILDTSAHTFCVRRIPYDIQATQARVRAWLCDAPAALLDGKGGLAERLARGI